MAMAMLRSSSPSSVCSISGRNPGLSERQQQPGAHVSKRSGGQFGSGRVCLRVQQGRGPGGNSWQRRTCKGGVRSQLGGVSPTQEDEFGSDSNVPSSPGGNHTVQFDLNLPRRSALLEFTCNVCQARTQRMINPDAFRRGDSVRSVWGLSSVSPVGGQFKPR